MTREEKKAIKLAAKEQQKEDKKAARQWTEFINRMKAKGALIEP